MITVIPIQNEGLYEEMTRMYPLSNVASSVRHMASWCKLITRHILRMYWADRIGTVRVEVRTIVSFMLVRFVLINHEIDEVIRTQVDWFNWCLKISSLNSVQAPREVHLWRQPQKSGLQ